MLRVACSILVLAVAAAGYGQAQMSPEVMLEGGIRAEVVDGNLAEAIAIYESVASRPDVDRAVAAKALLHLAGCYEKLGDDAALAVYQRIRDDYADVADVAASARERLAAMPEAGPASQDRVRLVEPAHVAELGMGATDRSPDGRYGVFTHYAEAYNVGVVDYETEEVTWLTDFATLEEGVADHATWSPDSRRVAYAASGADGFHEVRVFTLGGTSEVVYRTAAVQRSYFTARPTSWTPDGRALALILDNGDESVTVGVLDIDRGDVAQLATFAWERRQTNGPQFSPDGRHLALVRPVDGNDEIFTLAVDGSKMTRLTDDPAADGWPLWSRDGSHILFASDRLGQKGLWAVAVQDGAASSAPILLDRSFPAFRAMTWVGDRLSFFERNFPSDIYTVPVDPASGEATGPARKIPFTPTGANVGVAWSRDGALAFFTREGADKVNVLFPDGATADFRLPAGFEGTLNSLQFDSQGKIVTFANTRGKMASVDIESGEWSVVALPDDAGQCCVMRGPAPDTVYYVTSFLIPPQRIQRLDLRSSEAMTFFEFDEVPDSSPRMRLSPDGHRLRLPDGRTFAEIGLDTGRVESRINVDESVLPVGSGVDWGDLSPDGSKLAIVGEDELQVLDLESGEVHSLGVRLDQLFAGLETNTSSAQFRYVRWSPKGDQIAFQAQIFDMSTWTIEDPLGAALRGAVSR